MGFIRTLGITMVLVLAAPLAAAQVFKWTDKDGRVHYGEKPPEGVKATQVNVTGSVTGANSPAPAPAATQTWQEQDTEFRKRQVKRDEAERASKEREENAVERAKICENARKRLEILRAQVPVYSRDDQGNRTYMDDAMRASEVEKETKREQENCGR